MARAFIGLGSNVGDRAAHIEAALRGLAHLPRTRLVQSSPIYETAPVGPVRQGDFLNAAAELQTELAPPELLAGLAAIEGQSGRQPQERREHWGPRTLDLDILFYDEQVIHLPGGQPGREPGGKPGGRGLDVPHPRLHERWFVLRPLADLDGSFIHPVLKRSVRELLAEVEAGKPAAGRRFAEKP